MRFKFLLGLSLALSLLSGGSISTAAPSAKRSDTLQWWQDSRFGMFIHFGVYSTLARGEWVRSVEKISVEGYQPFVDSFNPVDYDARKMARIAKAAGMKYAVMTAKHHDGFCLFDSKLTDYKSTKTPIKRDLIREFVDAFRAEGLRVGLYYSLLDWHHPDYPHYGDNHHPARDDAAFKDRKHDFNKYLTYMHGQIKELVTNYGRIDIFWFDFSYGNLKGDAWKAEELVRVVRTHQPHAILNNRLAGDGVNHSTGYGDFITPEQDLPDSIPVDAVGKPVPWESCLTLNQSWGYNATDNRWKSSRQLVGALINAVSKGGNLLLNVGPDGRGNIPERSVQTLAEMGEWMHRNGKAIYGAGAAPMPKPEWGRLTRRGNTWFAHVTDPGIGHLKLPGLWSKFKSARVLFDGAAAGAANSHWGNNMGDMLLLNVGSPTYKTYEMPDPLVTVFSIELTGPPQISAESSH